MVDFEIFLDSFKDKQSTPYDRKVAEEIFIRGAIDPVLPLTEIFYEDGSAEIHGLDEANDQIHSLVIPRFFGRTVLDRVLELARKTGSLISWPGEETYMAVTDPLVLAHLPDELAEHRLAIVIVQNIDELIEAMELIWVNADNFNKKTCSRD